MSKKPVVPLKDASWPFIGQGLNCINKAGEDDPLQVVSTEHWQGNVIDNAVARRRVIAALRNEKDPLREALKMAGYMPKEIIELYSRPGLLHSIQHVISGTAKIVTCGRVEKHIIDCNADPCTPYRGEVVEHRKGEERFELDITKIGFYLTAQQAGGVIRGHELRKELIGQPVLNANVLEYLLDHTELIPNRWKGKSLTFWGTIYRHHLGALCVRYLYWIDGGHGWSCHDYGLDCNFDDHQFIAVLVNN